MSQPYPPLLTPPHCATPPPLLSSRVNEKSDFNIYEDIESKPHVWEEPVVEKPDWDGNTMGRFLEFLHTGDYRHPEPSSELEVIPESEGVLLVHAKLYLLARYKNLTALQSLAVSRLRTALGLISISERTAKKVIELLQYIHSRTSPQEPARELVVGYVAGNFRTLKAVSGREMKLLLCGGGDLAVELMHKMVTRQFGSENGFGGNMATILERVERGGRRNGDIESGLKVLHVEEAPRLDAPSAESLVVVVDKGETSEDLKDRTTELKVCHMVNKEQPIPQNEVVEEEEEEEECADIEDTSAVVQDSLAEGSLEDKKGFTTGTEWFEASSNGAKNVESELMGDDPSVNEDLDLVTDVAIEDIQDVEGGKAGDGGDKDGKEGKEGEVIAGLEVGTEDLRPIDRAEAPKNTGGIEGSEDEVDPSVMKIPQTDIAGVADQANRTQIPVEQGAAGGGRVLSRRLYISLQAWFGLRPPAEASWRLR
ncbi:hypothetical protein P167DRAFT_602999 [Morchella conica CCBAS932]|uniref:BTB domain-containing protein n=1 Tax=Morchella conica CCBAS932 TaxID=1392247 RepID=A0A3N4L5M2_9PEZI|nr:hypothetical protein P167DRAFT_602999 [Morchella conica CCBAS932]